MGNTLEGRKQARQTKEDGKYFNYVAFQLSTSITVTYVAA